MVRIGHMAVSGAVAALALSIASPAQVTVTVNLATQYQTIEGFGAYMAINPWKVRSGPFYVDVNLDAVGFYDSLVSELGVTMWRTNVADKADDFEPSEGVFNLSGSGLPATYTMETSTATAKRVQGTAGLSGIPVPATSIVTLVSGQYSHTEPVTAVAPRRAQPRTTGQGLARHSGSQRCYALTGRALARPSRTAGVFVARSGQQPVSRLRLVAVER